MYSDSEAESIFKLTGVRPKNVRHAVVPTSHHHRADVHHKRVPGFKAGVHRSCGPCTGHEPLSHFDNSRTAYLVSGMLEVGRDAQGLAVNSPYRPGYNAAIGGAAVLKIAAAASTVPITPEQAILKRMSPGARGQYLFYNDALTAAGLAPITLQGDLGFDHIPTTPVITRTQLGNAMKVAPLSQDQRDVTTAASAYVGSIGYASFDKMPPGDQTLMATDLANIFLADQAQSATLAAALQTYNTASAASSTASLLQEAADRTVIDADAAYTADPSPANKAALDSALTALGIADDAVTKADSDANHAMQKYIDAGGSPNVTPSTIKAPPPPQAALPPLDATRGDTTLASGVILRGDAMQYVALLNESLTTAGLYGVTLADIYGSNAALPPDVRIGDIQSRLGNMHDPNDPRSNMISAIEGQVDHTKLGLFTPEELSKSAQFYATAPAQAPVTTPT